MYPISYIREKKEGVKSNLKNRLEQVYVQGKDFIYLLKKVRVDEYLGQEGGLNWI